MTFIKEITPYIERIKLHQQGGRITKIEILREIRDIHFKYIRSNDFDEPSNLGCSNCVRQMINQLVGKIDRDSKKGIKMSFPKVEEKVVFNSTIDEWQEDNLKEIEAITVVSPKVYTPNLINHKSMKWGAFKKYCTSKGITVKGKKRTELEEELNNL